MNRLPTFLPGDFRETYDNLDAAETPSYHEFSRRIRVELGESSLLEQVLLDRIVASTWRLAQGDELPASGSSAAKRAESRAERSLHRSLEMLESLRAARADFPVHPKPRRSERVEPVSRPDPDDSHAEPLCESWRDRLTFEPRTSANSPIVKGTWVTVDHVISLIVDNWSWSDILRTHPELIEDDIRACLSYAIEQSHDAPC